MRSDGSSVSVTSRAWEKDNCDPYFSSERLSLSNGECSNGSQALEFDEANVPFHGVGGGYLGSPGKKTNKNIETSGSLHLTLLISWEQ